MEDKPFSVETLEEEIREAAGSVVQYAPPAARSPLPALPEYVQHDPATPEIGKLTAESVAREFEETAKQVDALREEFLAGVAGMRAEIENAMEVVRLLQDTAQRARENGKAAFERIAMQSKITAQIREQITAINESLQ